MKYSCQIDIDRPRDRVLELFEDPESLKHWQDGLEVFEPLSENRTAKGAQTRLVYKMGKRDIEMIETLDEYAPPDRMSAIYTAKGVWNHNLNRFIDLGDRTRWEVDTEFRCSGFMRIMAFFMPGMFRKQTEKFMQQFKDYVEAQPA